MTWSSFPSSACDMFYLKFCLVALCTWDPDDTVVCDIGITDIGATIPSPHEVAALFLYSCSDALAVLSNRLLQRCMFKKKNLNAVVASEAGL